MRTLTLALASALILSTGCARSGSKGGGEELGHAIRKGLHLGVRGRHTALTCARDLEGQLLGESRHPRRGDHAGDLGHDGVQGRPVPAALRGAREVRGRVTTFSSAARAQPHERDQGQTQQTRCAAPNRQKSKQTHGVLDGKPTAPEDIPKHPSGQVAS